MCFFPEEIGLTCLPRRRPLDSNRKQGGFHPVKVCGTGGIVVDNWPEIFWLIVYDKEK